MNTNNRTAHSTQAPTTPKNRLLSALRRLIGSSPETTAPQTSTFQELSTSRRKHKRPLQRDISPSKPYPADALGTILGDAAKELHEAIQAPLAICGSSVLAAAHLAAQAHADVSVDGRTYPLSGFFISVSESGARKTAVDTAVLREVRRYEKSLHDSYAKTLQTTEFRATSRRTATARATLDQALHPQAVGNSTETQQPTSNLPPLLPMILSEEPTFEGLVKSLTYGYPSQGLFSDEGGRFLGGYALNSDNMTATLAGLSKLWDAKPLDRVRAGDGALKLYGRRLSFHLLIQPEIVRSLMSNRLAQDQGFLSRCLVTIPPSTIGNRMYRSIDVSTLPSVERFQHCIRNLLSRDLPVEDRNDPARRSQLSPRVLTLSSETKEIYVSFHDHVERAMLADFRELRAFANKAPEHLLRIAGTMAIIEDGDTTVINKQHALNARSLVEFYLNEARRIDELSRQDPDLRIAQALLEWITDLQRPVSLVEIYQCGPSHLRNARRARHFVRILADHGHLVPEKNVRFRGVTRDEGWKLAE